MLYGFCKKSNHRPNLIELRHSVMRNFDGLQSVNAVQTFEDELTGLVTNNQVPYYKPTYKVIDI